VGLEPLRQQFIAAGGHIFKSQSVIILDETDPIEEYSQLDGGARLTVAENELALEGGIQGSACVATAL